MALLSIAETAEELGLGKRTVEQLLAEGRIVPVRIGARVLIEPDELARFVRAHRDAAKVVEPATSRQLIAIHARADAADRATGSRSGTAKTHVKEWASREYGRDIESLKELSYEEASGALDELARLLEEAQAAGHPHRGEPAAERGNQPS